jgi:gamma-glutamylcyclotransferase (GGCT)/AIG2-like uncharacterized protein YtfP
MKFVGKGELLATLFDIGEYPAIIPAKQENEMVEGDIFEISHTRKVFKILDEYEGFYKNDLKNSEYLRKKSIIHLENGKNVTAWVYWYNFSVENKPKILNKNYLAYLQEIAQNK